jgi:hypothetical protein
MVNNSDDEAFNHDLDNDNDIDDFSPLVVRTTANDQQSLKGCDTTTGINSSKIIIWECRNKIVIVLSLIVISISVIIGYQIIGTSGTDSNGHSQQYYNNKLLQMQSKFQSAKLEFIEQLKSNYGEDYYEKMFLNEKNKTNGGDKFLKQSTNGTSNYRFLRKIKVKILQSLLTYDDDNFSNSSNSNDSFSDSTDTKDTIQFVWATGGHSAAAGHGNFYHESYTGQLERVIRPVLEHSLGITFIGRNYAMGATSSANEIGICSKEIFGTDIDVLSWDYGMTDGYEFERAMLYFYRTAAYVKGLACITLNAGGGNGGFADSEHMKITDYLDTNGLIALQSSDEIFSAAIDAIPDTFGLSDDEISKMPPYIQNFKCENRIEEGDPYCKDAKYNLTYCPTRSHMASWHPGWYVSRFVFRLIFFSLRSQLTRSSFFVLCSKGDGTLSWVIYLHPISSNCSIVPWTN